MKKILILSAFLLLSGSAFAVTSNQGSFGEAASTKVSSGNILSSSDKKSIDKVLSGLYLKLDKKFEYPSEKGEFISNIIDQLDIKLAAVKSSSIKKKDYMISIIDYMKNSLNEKMQTFELRI